ncbi:MAG: KUP/HAK/KT family potassium transporter [Verrucomicrobiota bacterium]
MSSTHSDSKHSLNALTLGALGIVFGDIGTSPLYTMNECLRHLNGGERQLEVLGVLSLIFWSLVLVVSIKYILFVSRANNQGEGGIFALLALLKKDAPQKTSVHIGASVLLILMGTALLYGDGVITPAISVLSATEGLNTISQGLHFLVIPLACIILAILFWFQHKGSARIGKVFGPIMFVWFSSLAFMGLWQILQYPAILFAINPVYGFHLLIAHPSGIFEILGAVVLAITGGEALYADMGHFGRPAISRAWHIVVLPSLFLNYFGQGAYAVTHLGSTENLFFSLAPNETFKILLLGLSMMATVIASQALISGAFSLTRQAVQMGYFPRVKIVHTSASFQGQIYIGSINWFLALGSIALVLGFKSSDSLASAYGIAVTGTMAITTIAFYWVIRSVWKWTRLQALPICALFLVVDLAFFTSNLTKFFDGGWLPILIGFVLLALMHAWKLGRASIVKILEASNMSVEYFLEDLKANNIVRTRGTAVFMAANPKGMPVALLHHLKCNYCLHQTVIILSLITESVPQINEAERSTIEFIGENIWRVIGRFGYMETPDVEALIKKIDIEGVKINPQSTIYYFNHEKILTDGTTKMWKWEKELYAIMSRNASPARDYFRIPANRIVEMGLPIKLWFSLPI